MSVNQGWDGPLATFVQRIELDPGPVGPGTTVPLTVSAATQLAQGQRILVPSVDLCVGVQVPQSYAAGTFGAWGRVDANGDLDLQLRNNTAGALNPGLGTFFFVIYRRLLDDT